jgi:hypothetical protein
MRDGPYTCSQCGCEADGLGLHASLCNKNPDGCLKTSCHDRHDCVRDDVADLARNANLATRKEVMLSAASKARPADVLIHMRGQSVAVDTTVVSFFKSKACDFLERSASRAFAAIFHDIRRAKEEKHAATCASAGVHFRALALSSLGAVDPSGGQLLRALSSCSARQETELQDTVLRQTLTRVQIQVLRGTTGIILHNLQTHGDSSDEDAEEEEPRERETQPDAAPPLTAPANVGQQPTTATSRTRCPAFHSAMVFRPVPTEASMPPSSALEAANGQVERLIAKLGPLSEAAARRADLRRLAKTTRRATAEAREAAAAAATEALLSSSPLDTRRHAADTELDPHAAEERPIGALPAPDPDSEDAPPGPSPDAAQQPQAGPGVSHEDLQSGETTPRMRSGPRETLRTGLFVDANLTPPMSRSASCAPPPRSAAQKPELWRAPIAARRPRGTAAAEAHHCGTAAGRDAAVDAR